MNSRAFRFGVQCSSVTDPRVFRELAHKLEDLGYSSLTIADHFDDQLAPTPMLGAAAEFTNTLRLGAMVWCNDYRHPVVLAKEAATLDLLSDGRLELGLGAGWMTTDYETSGIPFDRASIRIARLEEALHVIKGCMRGKNFSFDGEHYTIDELTGSPLPQQRPWPPIVVGGGGPKVMAVAGRHADIVSLNPNLAAGVIDSRAGATATHDATMAKLAIIREAAGDRFDEIEIQCRVHLAMVSDDREGVAEAMAPALGLSIAEAKRSIHALVGSVPEIVEQLHQRRETYGINYIGISADSVDDLAPVVAALS